MPKTYSDWLGRQVVLQIEAAESLVPLRGRVVKESNNALRFRLDGGWEVDIFKEMILRVEADDYEALQLSNSEATKSARDAARSDSRPLLGRSRDFNRGSRNSSWHLRWMTILSEGLAGSVLFVLALHMDVSAPIAHFVRYMCGYVGLVFCAVSLGCGVWVLMDAIGPQPHFLAKWSKILASFLDWFRQPIRL